MYWIKWLCQRCDAKSGMMKAIDGVDGESGSVGMTAREPRCFLDAFLDAVDPWPGPHCRGHKQQSEWPERQ
jgi:hypothetical protein